MGTFGQAFAQYMGNVGSGGETGVNTLEETLELAKRKVEAAKERGMFTICLLGKEGGLVKDLCDLPIIINSDNIPRIQEAHITIIHMICEIVESELFKDIKRGLLQCCPGGSEQAVQAFSDSF